MKFSPIFLSACSLLQFSAAQVNPLSITPTVPGEFRLDWIGENQRGYQMEGSPDLRVWTDIDAHVLGTGSPMSMLVASSADKYFYRLRRGAVRPGFRTTLLGRTDDSYPSAIALGFTINYFDFNATHIYLNDDGNLTLGGANNPIVDFYVEDMYLANKPTIAPFWADSDTTLPAPPDTSYSDDIGFGSGVANGRNAFGATFRNVGYFYKKSDKLNSFQTVIIDRGDTGAGNFDLEFNYDKIEWESSDSALGINGIGGTVVRAGLSNGLGGYGTGDTGFAMEIEGSGQTLAFLDRNPISGEQNPSGLVNQKFNSDYPGRILIPFRNGYPEGSRFRVDAGPNQTLAISAPATATLAGSVTLTDAGQVQYRWRATNPNASVITSDPTQLTPTVTLLRPGNHGFELVGTRVMGGILRYFTIDRTTIFHPATMSVDAGENQEFVAAEPPRVIQLQGSGSYSGTHAATFLWESIGDGSASISDASILQPNVTLNEFGTYTFRLTITANGFTMSDVVIINFQHGSEA